MFYACKRLPSETGSRASVLVISDPLLMSPSPHPICLDRAASCSQLL